MPLFPNAIRISFTRDTRFSVSSSLPPRVSAAGYSQSRSTPSKLYSFMRSIKEEMKTALFAAVETMSLHVVLVAPGSLKSKPPTPIHV